MRPVNRMLAEICREAGMTTRTAGKYLGITHQRVSQLTPGMKRTCGPDKSEPSWAYQERLRFAREIYHILGHGWWTRLTALFRIRGAKCGTETARRINPKMVTAVSLWNRGLPAAKIAALMNTTSGTVDQYIHHARKLGMDVLRRYRSRK